MGFNSDGSISRRTNGKDVREHRLVYEQHYNCCLLPSTAIRHKNGINWDNRIENLEVWTKRARASQFGRFAEPIPLDRHCMRCGSSETKIEDDGRHHWFRGHGDYAGGYLCDSCYKHEYQNNVVRAHRRVWENHQPFPCCLVNWYECCFKNGIKKDIRIENLEIRKRGTSSTVTRRIPRRQKKYDLWKVEDI